MKRYAAHELQLETGERLPLFFHEIDEGRVVNYGHLTQEMAMTEWVEGRISLHRDSEGTLHAYWNGHQLA